LLGAIKLDRAEYGEAERLLRKAILPDKKNFNAHNDLGRLLVKTRRFAEADRKLELLKLLSKAQNKKAM
jgi:Flp pilus assembly protein TadD